VTEKTIVSGNDIRTDFSAGSPALAQQFDLSAGVSGLTGPSSTADLQTIGGGAYPTFGLDFLFFTIWESALTRLFAPNRTLPRAVTIPALFL